MTVPGDPADAGRAVLDEAVALVHRVSRAKNLTFAAALEDVKHDPAHRALVEQLVVHYTGGRTRS